MILSYQVATIYIIVHKMKCYTCFVTFLYPSQVGNKIDWPALTYLCAFSPLIAFTRLLSYTSEPGSRGGNVGRAKRYVTTASVVVNAILVVICWCADLKTGDILILEEFVRAFNNADMKRCKILLVSSRSNVNWPFWRSGRSLPKPSSEWWSVRRNPFRKWPNIRGETCDVI